MICGHRLAKERLCCVHALVRSEERGDGLAALVDCAIEIVQSAPHGHCSLVHPPGGTHMLGESVPSSLVLGYVAQDPSHYGRVGDDDPALGHHGCQVAI